MKHMSRLSAIIFFLAVASASAQNGLDQLRQLVRNIPGLEATEISTMETALQVEMGARLFNVTLPDTLLNSLGRIINAGFFEEAEAITIARVTRQVYEAETRGAPAAYVEDLALVGFSRPMTTKQLEASAKALQQYRNSELDPVIYQELISYGLYNAWKGSIIEGINSGLIRGLTQGVDAGKLALALIIRVDQGLDDNAVNAAVTEEIAFLKSRRSNVEKRRRDESYQAMQDAVKKGVSRSVAQELYYEAIEEKWPTEVTREVFNGMVEARKLGLTPEKMALAMIIRVDQGLEGVSPQQMVREELDYVKRVDKDRVTIVQGDLPDVAHTPEPPKDYQVFIDEPERRDKKPTTPDIIRSKNRNQINVALMQESIQSFMGTPYRWGGNTRRGTDCSGFTQTVYKEQGLLIPRVSRDQFRVGNAVSTQGLKFGDLIFFNKHGYGRITHVAIYVGNGQFAHSSCSKGVNITSLDKRYYRVRYAGAKRVI